MLELNFQTKALAAVFLANPPKQNKTFLFLLSNQIVIIFTHKK